MEGGEALHNTSREELLRLLPDCRAPEPVAKRLAEAGIMRVIKGEQEDDPVRYVVEIAAFVNVPDRVLAVLYSELCRFYLWYEERKRYLASDAEAAEKRQDKGFVICQGTAPLIAQSEEALEKEAARFARIFINQWKRYQ